MDVLVILCAQQRLVPSDHVIKLISTNQNHISFKPNSPIGSLEFEKVLLQARGMEDANRKKPHLPVVSLVEILFHHCMAGLMSAGNCGFLHLFCFCYITFLANSSSFDKLQEVS